ncbi:hypothetical protein J5U46_08545 [Micromonospora tulbaghiae]|uniref:DUF3558 domain-containing protein n=1 Tax=Micromonospora tulbaghiae TaxID=479978 RepID=A0AAW4JMZ4_9ACTN|nr:hypothetical protein [Micromonospora tulbaghiae]MBO4140189.1 hypothetical protein [Micromonospora tulbaghiae]
MRLKSVRPWRLSVVAIALAAAVTACTAKADDNPRDKEEPLQTKPVAEVLQLVQTGAQAVADAAGSPLNGWSTNTVPCEGRGGEIADDGRWYLGASANLRVAPAEQIATLARVREALRQQGYEITEDRTFADGTRGSFSARDPNTAITVTLTTTKNLDHMAVGLLSDCYMPVDGEDPANA